MPVSIETLLRESPEMPNFRNLEVVETEKGQEGTFSQESESISSRREDVPGAAAVQKRRVCWKATSSLGECSSTEEGAMPTSHCLCGVSSRP